MPEQPPLNDLRAGFARAEDGQPLYWRSAGAGPALVCCNGAGVSTFFFKYLVKHFRPGFQVVVWDYRGHGRSPPPPEPIDQADLGVERAAADLDLVLSDAGVERPFILVGHSMGVQVAFEHLKSHPERPAAAVVALFGTSGRPVDTFLDLPLSRPVFDRLARLLQRGGRLGSRLVLPLYGNAPLAYRLAATTGLLDGQLAEREDIAKYLEHLAAMDPRVFVRMVSQMADHDLDAWLPEVTVPVLVIAGERDRFTPLHRSERLAERVPGAELHVVANGTHAAIVERPEEVNLRIERFLAERLGLRLSDAGADGAADVQGPRPDPR